MKLDSIKLIRRSVFIGHDAKTVECIERISQEGGAPYTLCHKNDSDFAHYNFNVQQPILIILDRDIAEWVLSNGDLYPTSPK